MNAFEQLLKVIEKETGMTVAQIRDASPEVLRRHLTSRTGRETSFCSEFPTVGRGSVLRDFVTSKDLERQLDSILH